MSYHRKGRRGVMGDNVLDAFVDDEGHPIPQDTSSPTTIPGAFDQAINQVDQTIQGSGNTVTGVSLIDWLTGAITPAASSTSSTDFNTTKFPGVCKPTNVGALKAVQELQRQLNRVAQVKGIAKTGVDGDLGQSTVTLFRLVQAASGGAVAGDGSSCMGIGSMLAVITEQVKGFANGLGAPATVPGGVMVSAPSIMPPGATKPQAVSTGFLQGFTQLSTVEKLAVVGALGGVAYVALGKRRRGRR